MSREIFIGNLNATIEERKIRSLLKPYGPIHQIRMMQAPFEGFAQVEFFTKQSAARAMQEFSGKDPAGTPLTVSWAAGVS